MLSFQSELITGWPPICRGRFTGVDAVEPGRRWDRTAERSVSGARKGEQIVRDR